MKIEVRFFASLVDRTGCSSEIVEVDPSSTVEALWSLLLVRHPALREAAVRPMVACDMVYSDWACKLDGVGEVAFLTPVSGG